MEAKIVEVEEAVLRGFEATMVALNKSVVDGIKSVEPEADVAPEFPRPEPIEHASSLAKTIEQNVSILRKAAERKASEGEEAEAIAVRMTKLVDHQRRGSKPCPDCKTAGKTTKGKDCDGCSGEGWIAK